MRGLSYCIGVVVILCIAAVAWADPIVTLNPDQTCYEPGETVAVTIDLTGSGFPNIVGGQFFLEFTSANLTYVSAAPGSPWTIEVYEYVTSNQINYAVGIPDGGTGATSGTMATLTFTAGAQICDTASLVSFRSGANPPTRLGDVNDVEYSVPKANLTLNALGAITIDNTPPTATAPTNVTVECVGDVPTAATTYAEFTALGGTASDNCSAGADLTITHVDGALSGGECGGTITRTYTVTDECGNDFDVDQTITVDDTIDPVATAPTNVTVECVGDVPTAATTYAEFTALGGTASDNCSAGADLTITHVDGALSGGECGGTITRTYTVTDECGNDFDVDQTITVDDTTAPSVADCPTNISVNADAGLCTADVSWSAPTVTDNCDASPTVEYDIDIDDDTVIDDTITGTTYTFPGGTHRVIVNATDDCSNLNDTCTFNVTVSAHNELVLDLDLVDMGASGTLTRCITFELFDCGGGSEVVTQDVTFTNGAADAATVLVPCGAYDCITVRDALHTLRRTDDDTGSFLIVGAQYTADFSGGIGGKALICGNLNDDDFIDILDFTIYVNRWNVTYDSNGDLTADGNTPCGWTPTPQGPYHADLTGDGRVLTNDFTFVQTYFLYEREANCCGLPELSSGGPRTAVSVEELQAMGLGTAADLDGDGWVDEVDIVAFANGDRPPAPPVPPTAPKKPGIEPMSQPKGATAGLSR